MTILFRKYEELMKIRHRKYEEIVTIPYRKEEEIMKNLGYELKPLSTRTVIKKIS